MATCSAIELRRNDEGRSPALWAVIFDHQAWRVGTYASPPSVSDPVKQEAVQVLDRVERLCRPVGLDRMRAWLTRLSWAVSNPPADSDFEKRLEAVAMGLAEFPAGAFTQATMTAASREFRFWPSVAELTKFLEPVRDSLRDDLESLRYAASPPQRRSGSPTLAKEQKNAALDAFRAARVRQGVSAPSEAMDPSGTIPGAF